MTIGVHEPACTKCGAHYGEESLSDKGLCPECRGENTPAGIAKAKAQANADRPSGDAAAGKPEGE
jgi:predicted Zn-ribbon and HTH transcriptional regulator